MRLEDLRRTCTVAILFFNDGNNELINYNQSRSDAPTVMIHPPIRPLLAQEDNFENYYPRASVFFLVNCGVDTQHYCSHVEKYP